MKTKILYIGNKLSGLGNTITSIETLGASLEKEGYDMVYASSKKNKIYRILDMFNTTIKYSRGIKVVLIDVYSTQNFWYALIISQLCRVLNLKYIAKLHGGNLPNRLNNNPYLCDLIFKNSFKNVAPSHYLYSSFLSKYSSNLVHISNTIEIENYSCTERKFNEPKLLWVRSFSKIYNPKMAIDVLAEVKKKYPSATLCMVGPDKENLIENCKNYADGKNVSATFTGKLSKKEWIELSKEYNIFINTTHFDNMPISVIEALALGIPVVSTNVGGIPFLLDNDKTALLVNDNDVSAMSNSVIEIIENSNKRNHLIANGRNLAESFDWENIKSKWNEILK